MVSRFLREQAGDGPRGDGDSHECPYWDSRGSLHELYASPCCNSSRCHNSLVTGAVFDELGQGELPGRASVWQSFTYVGSVHEEDRPQRPWPIAACGEHQPGPADRGPRRILQGSREPASSPDVKWRRIETPPWSSDHIAVNLAPISSLCWPESLIIIMAQLPAQSPVEMGADRLAATKTRSTALFFQGIRLFS